MPDENVIVVDFLAHHGVKGMRWGVRKDKGHEGEPATNRKISRLDKKFARNAGTTSTWVAINNRAADFSNGPNGNDGTIAEINNKPEYSHEKMLKAHLEAQKVQNGSVSDLHQRYYKEQQTALLKNLQKAADEMGTNASGTKRYEIVKRDPGGWWSWEVKVGNVQHADGAEPNILVHLVLDKVGRIMGYEFGSSDTPFQHSEDTDDFLAHYGIKGMHWGIRHPRGKNGRVDTSSRTHYKKPPKNLTEAELQRRIKRMETEKRYNELNKRDVSVGKKHVTEIITNVGKGTIQTVAGAVALYAIKKALFKKFGEEKFGPKPVIFPKKK